MMLKKWYAQRTMQITIAACTLVFFGVLLVQPTLAAAKQASSTKRYDQAQESIYFRASQPKLPLWQKIQWTLTAPPSAVQSSASKQAPQKIAMVQPSKEQHMQIDFRQAVRLPQAKIKKKKQQLRLAAAGAEAQKRHEAIGLWHQIFGLSSLALMAASVVIGQINAIDFLNDRLSSEPLIWTHRGLILGTAITYLAARILAWMLPKVEDTDEDGGFNEDGETKEKSFDSSKIHNLLSWIHGIGMLALMIGGFINARFIPSYTPAKTAFTVSHLVSGYVTLASMGAAAIVISYF